VRLSRGTAGSWLVRQLAPLVSLCRLVSASSALVALGPFLSALVTRTGWCSARPAARASGLAPRWSPLVSACRSRSFLERACHADRLVLSSSGSSRHWSRSALVSAVCACCTNPRCVRLYDSVPWWLVCRSRTALVSAAHFFSGRSVPPQSIRLEQKFWAYDYFWVMFLHFFHWIQTQCFRTPI
jgi:hypothetical protein